MHMYSYKWTRYKYMLYKLVCCCCCCFSSQCIECTETYLLSKTDSVNFVYFNPFTHSVPYKRHMQSVWTQIRRRSSTMFRYCSWADIKKGESISNEQKFSCTCVYNAASDRKTSKIFRRYNSAICHHIHCHDAFFDWHLVLQNVRCSQRLSLCANSIF